MTVSVAPLKSEEAWKRAIGFLSRPDLDEETRAAVQARVTEYINATSETEPRYGPQRPVEPTGEPQAVETEWESGTREVFDASGKASGDKWDGLEEQIETNQARKSLSKLERFYRPPHALPEAPKPPSAITGNPGMPLDPLEPVWRKQGQSLEPVHPSVQEAKKGTVYYEPYVATVEEALAQNPKLREAVGAPREQTEFDLDEESPLYKKAADILWVQAYDEAMSEGRELVRLSQAEGDLDKAKYLLGKYGAIPAAQAILHADRLALFGLGEDLGTALTDAAMGSGGEHHITTGPDGEVLGKFDSMEAAEMQLPGWQGVHPEAQIQQQPSELETLREQAHPAIAAMGAMAGAVTPGGAPSRMVQGASKIPVVAKGLQGGAGTRMATSAGIGAGVAGAESAGLEMADRATGDVAARGDYAETLLPTVLAGALFGAGGQVLGDLASLGLRKLRARDPKLKAEHEGAHLEERTAQRQKAYEDASWADPSRKAPSQQLADEILDNAEKAARSRAGKLDDEIDSEVTRFVTSNRGRAQKDMGGFVRRGLEMALDAERRPGAEKAPFGPVLGKMVRAKLADRAAPGQLALSVDEAEAVFGRKFIQQAIDNTPHVNDASMLSKVILTPKKMNAQQVEMLISDLTTRWTSSDPNTGPKKLWNALLGEAIESRKLWGDSWHKARKRHAEKRREHERLLEPTGLPKDIERTPDKSADRWGVYDRDGNLVKGAFKSERGAKLSAKRRGEGHTVNKRRNISVKTPDELAHSTREKVRKQALSTFSEEGERALAMQAFQTLLTDRQQQDLLVELHAAIAREAGKKGAKLNVAAAVDPSLGVAHSRVYGAGRKLKREVLVPLLRGLEQGAEDGPRGGVRRLLSRMRPLSAKSGQPARYAGLSAEEIDAENLIMAMEIADMLKQEQDNGSE